ncbi:MAG: dodecin family protein [Firmicutes bacterium]|nr:dodecin family protein [Bacillota bacterium]
MTVVKVIEVLGESTEGWQEAVENAVHEATRTIHNISGVEVLNLTANVKEDQIVEYKADVQIAFAVDGKD